MTPKPVGAKVAVSNQQRRVKINTRLLAQIAEGALSLVGDNEAQLSVVLVDDAAIAKLNARYHDTTGPTDVLSFDYGEGEGELIISVERALAQATRFRSTPAREIVLYVVHGILHLHGYDDLAPPDCKHMRAVEREIMTKLARSFTLEGVVSRNVAKL
jgi:probable rRNA maturation factor